MKTLLQPTMSTTADAAAREGFAGNYGTPVVENEVAAELQARLADTEARLADALNRLAFREAELAALAPEGAARPRRAALMARLAELELASGRHESELQDVRRIAKAREAELDQTKSKLKAVEKSAKLREAELDQTKSKLKALEKRPKLPETELRQPEAKLGLREAERGPAKPKVTQREPELAPVHSARPWKVVRKAALAVGKSLGIAKKGNSEREALRRHAELLTTSELFDVNWYLAAYPDVAASGINPAEHYLRYGADEGRDPGPRFSTRKYLNRHPDVAQAGMNPLLHYLKFGREERRTIFALERHSAAKAKLKQPERGPAKPKVEQPESEREPAKATLEAREPVRSTRLWKVVREAARAAGKSLGITKNGLREREALRRHVELFTTSELFDGNWYLAAYPDVAASGMNPAEHYLRYGADEGRDPGPRFSTSKYLKRYPDVARAGMNPLVHYLEFGSDEQRAIFAANTNVAATTASAAKLPKRPALEPEPALGAATVFSLPPVIREEAAWLRHEALCRQEGRKTLELHGTILGWLPPSAQMVGVDSFASFPVLGAAAVFCHMMRLGSAKALGCFEADAECALPPVDLQGAPPGRLFLPNAGPLELADAWFASALDLRLRFAKPTPVLRFFQWDRDAGRLVLLSEAHVRASNGLADIPTVNPLFPILIAAGDAEGVIEGLFLLPFPSLCRGGCHHGELLAAEGGGLMERLLALSGSLAEAWLTSDQEAFAIGRIDVDLTNARGSEPLFSRAVQHWLGGCFDVRCRPIDGAAIADERIRVFLEERLRGATDDADELSERERSASYALQIGAGAIPSLRAMVVRGAPPLGSARLGASVLVDGATGKPRWLLDLARLDAGLLGDRGTYGAKVIPLREQASQADQPAAIHAARGFALAVTACDDSAARDERLGPVTRLAHSVRAIRTPSAPPEISVLCPYYGDEGRFAAFLDSLRLQTNVTSLEVIVTAASQRAKSGPSLEDLVRRFFPKGKVISCDDRVLPGTRLNLMAELARCDLLLIAAGVLLQDPRTLDTLRHIAEDEKAATASCVLRAVAAAGTTDRARLDCAGFYPDGKEEPGGLVAAFARIDSHAPLGSQTFPIVANPPPLFMTRKTTWRKLGGFNETLPELTTMAIDFAVRATTRGDVHLCTSALSATVVDEAIAVTPRTILLPSVTPPLAWRDAAARSIVVRSLVI